MECESPLVLYADVNDCHAENALLNAASTGDLDVVSHFIAVHMADVNVKDGGDRTPLHYAASNGHVSIVSALLGSGAEVNVKENRGWTPLHYAARNGHVSIVSALLGSGAEVNVKNRSGETPLHYAVYGHVSVVSALLGSGAEVNVKDIIDTTPLHYAAGDGHVSIVATLLGSGADVNVKGNQGRTPLHYAASGGHVSVYPALIAAGGHWGTVCADGSAVNPEGDTPPCVAAAECALPSVRNAGTNLCDCPAPNIGAAGADAPGDCHGAKTPCTSPRKRATWFRSVT